MRILYLLTSLGIGGAEKQVVALAERMKAKGHSVALIVLKYTPEEWSADLPVLRLNLSKTPLGILRGLRFAAKFLDLFRPDLIHSHTFPANIFARLLVLMLRLRGQALPLINTIHNVHEGGWRRMLIYRATDPLANSITAVSMAAAERFTRIGAVSARKMHVLTNGIDTEAFTPDRTRRKRMRTSMQVSGAFVWLAIGRLAPAKDYPNLLRAFTQVQQTHPSARLWIAGEGNIAQLEPDFTPSEASPSVQFLGLRRDIADLLDAADAFVLSSAWEGMPLVVGEAMAMEKFVVATDVGGVRELLGETGLLVPAKDSAALAQAMLEAMAKAEFERKVTGKAARERVKQHFSMDAKAAEWEQCYAQIMKEKHA